MNNLADYSSIFRKSI